VPVLLGRQERKAGRRFNLALAGQAGPEQQQQESATQQGATGTKGLQWNQSMGWHTGSWRGKAPVTLRT
jgi:hypothetical protein